MKFEVRLERGCDLDTEWRQKSLATVVWKGMTFSKNSFGDYEIPNPTDDEISLALDTEFISVVVYS